MTTRVSRTQYIKIIPILPLTIKSTCLKKINLNDQRSSLAIEKNQSLQAFLNSLHKPYRRMSSVVRMDTMLISTSVFLQNRDKIVLLDLEIPALGPSIRVFKISNLTPLFADFLPLGQMNLEDLVMAIQNSLKNPHLFKFLSPSEFFF